MGSFTMRLRARLLLLVLVPLIPALALALHTHLGQRRFGIARVEKDAMRVVQVAGANQMALVEAARQHLSALARLPDARRHNDNLKAYDGFFGNMPKVYSDYTDFGLLEADGELVSCAFPGLRPTNFADRTYFQRVLSTKDFAIGSYDAGGGPRKPSLLFGHPIFNDRGELTRVLYAALDLAVLNAVAAKAQLPSGGVVTVFDREGHILARFPDSEKWVGKNYSDSSVGRQALTKTEGTFEMLDADGVERLFAFTSLPAREGGNLFVSVGIPTALAFAEIKQNLIRNVAILAVVAVLAMLAALIYANSRILYPVKALSRTARKVAAGDLSARTGLGGSSGELIELAHAFDDMAESLQHQRTQTEQSARALRESEERVRLVLDTALDAVITVDASGAVTSWNNEAEKIFGWSRPEILGQRLSHIIIPPRYREAYERSMQGFIETGVGHVLNRRSEIFALRRDGTEIPVEISITGLRIGDEYSFSAFIRDITERRKAEERLRVVVEAAPNAMIMVGSGGHIAMVNGEVEKLFAYGRAELLGQPIEMLVPERFRTKHPGLRTAFFDAPHTRAMGAGRDLFGLRKDGSEVPIEIGLNPITTTEGRFVLASIIDITERKKAEERLRQFNAELETRVQERTAELRRSEQQVRTSLHEKEALLQEIHHRVKNNLQVIASLLSLQSGYIRDPKMIVQFQESRGRVHSMALIHEKLCRSENFATIDFAQHLRDLTAMLAQSYSAACGVRVEVNAEPIALDMDTAVPMGLIVNELVSNAYKHAFPAGRAGVIAVQLSRSGDSAIRLDVRDDGVGLPHGFDWKASPSLGVKVVTSLARQLRATVTISNGTGTHVCLTLPAPCLKKTP